MFTAVIHLILQNARNSRCSASPDHLFRCIDLAASCHAGILFKQCHSQIVSNGFIHNPYLATKLISAYASIGAADEAKHVFESLPYKSLCLYNSLITGFARNGSHRDAVYWFNQLCQSSMYPDGFALSAVSKASGDSGYVMSGESVHAKCVKLGLSLNVVVGNSLMSMYSKCGHIAKCLILFDEMPLRSPASWDIVFSSFASSGRIEVTYVNRMLQEGFSPDSFTASILLRLCGKVPRYVKELHCYIVRNELQQSTDPDLHLYCSLIDMYMKSGSISTSRLIFNSMKKRNLHIWTAIVNGYSINGEFQEAAAIFRRMQIEEKLEPNTVSLLSVLPACASTGVKEVHGFATRRGHVSATPLSNALIDTYSKTGDLTSASTVFKTGAFPKDVISWCSLIIGYGMHGRGNDAVGLYNEMIRVGHRPDAVALLCVLTACCKSGMIREGLDIYGSARAEYGVDPTVEISACVVEMVGRVGEFGKALEYVRGMKGKASGSAWGALVSGAVARGEWEMVGVGLRGLVSVEPGNPGNFVLGSNVLAGSRRWDDVAEVRTSMREMGIRKVPGCSWIMVNCFNHCFYASDTVHPSSECVYGIVNGLIALMKPVDCENFNFY